MSNPHPFNVVASFYDNLYQDRRCLAEDTVILARLKPFVDGRLVLDVGCGTGWFADQETNARSVRAFDISAAMLDRLREKHPEMTTSVGDMQGPWRIAPVCSVDCVVSLWCSPSYTSPEHFASQAYRVLKPGGLVFAMPHSVGADEGDGVRGDAYMPPSCYSDSTDWRAWEIDETVKAFEHAGFKDVGAVGFHNGKEFPVWFPMVAHRWLRNRRHVAGERAVFLIVTARKPDKELG